MILSLSYGWLRGILEIHNTTKSIHDFNSWTKVDVSELSRAPFHNPSQNPSVFKFKQFLDKQLKDKFPSMKTAKALIRKDKFVLDPETN